MCDQACTFVTGLYSSGQLTQYLVAVGGEDESGHTMGSCCWLMELLTGTWKGVRQSNYNIYYNDCLLLLLYR